MLEFEVDYTAEKENDAHPGKVLFSSKISESTASEGKQLIHFGDASITIVHIFAVSVLLGSSHFVVVMDKAHIFLDFLHVLTNRVVLQNFSHFLRII